MKHRVSDKEFVDAFKMIYPDFHKDEIILARCKVAKLLWVPAEVISINTNAVELHRKHLLSDATGLLGDLLDDIYYAAEELKMESVIQRLTDTENMGELIYFYLICIIQPENQPHKNQ